ncbi:hypothetical protein DFH27DRAFT_560039 [Peziza echinospora]|nr:hypothetical protein DFH27DRAFT_560039 [Peziza echinospora]
MMQATNVIRDKPEWWIKFKDEGIWRKWMEELAPALGDDEITPIMEQFMKDELAHMASIRNSEDGIDQGIDGTYKSDKIIPQSLKDELIAAIKPLEDVPEKFKDWHPRSNNQVLDLVHPSLYPYMIGTSRYSECSKHGQKMIPCLPYCGGGVGELVIKHPRSENTEEPVAAGFRDGDGFSYNYQWLPANISIDKETKEVRFESYINNLHPVDHKNLYYALEKILTKCVPMIDKVLHAKRYQTGIRVDRGENAPWGWYESMSDKFGDDATDEEYDSWYENRRPKIPDPDTFESYLAQTREVLYKTPQIDIHKAKLAPESLSEIGSGQVIVKLANIELTPEHPEYDGGSWHLEGMRNESIVMTLIYYYDSENISDNHLSFRHAVRTPEYEQNDNKGIRIVYGLYGELIQNLGYIVTKPDRVIAFPNVYQHRVSSFKLTDPTKPGHRKILAVFLVDPTLVVPSTANIAPQQLDWWKRELRTEVPLFKNLPGEIFENIIKYVEWPMSMETAKQVRLELMDERSRYVSLQNNNFEREMNLCEH